MDLIMSNTTGDLQQIGTIYISRVPGFNPFRVDHLFSFLCCVFCFVCLRSVFSASGLSIRFSQSYSIYIL